jgi:hypothetical protein
MKRQQGHPEFNFNAAVAAQDEAIKRVDENAEPQWKEAARRIVCDLARTGVPFTTDAVWGELAYQSVEFPHEPRAMGGIMMGLARAGVIRRLDDQRRSIMVDCHRRPKQLWIGCSSAKGSRSE